MDQVPTTDDRRALAAQRQRLLRQVAAALDRPMTALAFVWLGLLILDLTRGLTGWLAALNTLIWGVFVLHFAVEFLIAPAKGRYLRANWLTAVALLLPALRVLRIFRAFRALRAARAVRGAGLVRVLTSVNRGMAAARKALRRRGFGYVVLVTAVVTFAGAAGMYAFENPAALREAGHSVVADGGGGLSGYPEAVWWTAMTMTTMGADYFPKTPEGRLLGWLLAVYAFAVFGYITATLASLFIGRDQKAAEPSSGTGEGAVGLRDEVVARARRDRRLADGVAGGATANGMKLDAITHSERSFRNWSYGQNLNSRSDGPVPSDRYLKPGVDGADRQAAVLVGRCNEVLATKPATRHTAGTKYRSDRHARSYTYGGIDWPRLPS